MPLIQSKSKKAFKSNIKEEMASGKPLAQSLAIGYSVQRRNRKKMAKGGYVNDQAKSEQRPMPEERDQDSKMVSQNSSKKPLKNSDWTGRPTVAQAQSNNGRTVMPIKRPKMVPSSVLSTRMRDEEEHLQSSEMPGNPDEQPSKWRDEDGADRQGPESRDLKLKKMAKGGMLENPDHSGNLHNKSVDSEYGDGSEEDKQEEPAGLMEDDDQMRPSKEKYMSGEMEMLATGGEVDAPHEIDYTNKPDKGYGGIIFKAEGGEVEEEDMAIEHAASIAAAIMAKRKEMRQDSGSPDEDHMTMMAEGGEVDLDLNSMEQPNAYYKRNEDGLLKENYDEDMRDMTQPEDSNERSDEREMSSEDKHDNSLVSKIRSKMRMRSPITR